MAETNAGGAAGPVRSADEGQRRRRWLSAGTAAAVIVVGVLAFAGSRDLQYWAELGPGPGFFPRILGVLLAALGAMWLVALWRTGRVRGSSPVEAEMAVPSEAGAAAPEHSLPRVIAIVASLCVLAAVLEPLGYQLSMLVFLLFHLLVLGRCRVLVSAAIALAGSFGVFVVFTRLLAVPLPPATIPFLRDLGL